MALRQLLNKRRFFTSGNPDKGELEKMGVQQVEAYEGRSKIELKFPNGETFKTEIVTFDGFKGISMGSIHAPSSAEFLFAKPRKVDLDKWTSTIYNKSP